MSEPPTPSQNDDDDDPCHVCIPIFLFAFGIMCLVISVVGDVYYDEIAAVFRRLWRKTNTREGIQGEQRSDIPSNNPQQPELLQWKAPNLTLAGRVVAYRYTDECPICLGNFINGESCKVFSNCKHVYHQRCIDGWLVDHTNCPTCRAFVLRSESTHQNTGTA